MLGILYYSMILSCMLIMLLIRMSWYLIKQSLKFGING